MAAIPPATPLLGIKGWDSLKFLKLIVTLEKRFSVRFDAADVTRISTWGELMSLVAKMKIES